MRCAGDLTETDLICSRARLCGDELLEITDSVVGVAFHPNLGRAVSVHSAHSVTGGRRGRI